MPSALFSLTLVAALSAPGWPHGTLATYDGEMSAERAEDQVGAKTFTLTVLVAHADADSTTYLWTLAEKGRGAFPWAERYSAWRVSRDGRTIRGAAPAVLFDHGEGLGEASLELLFAQPADELAEGASWTQGRREFTVAEEASIAGHNAWRVEARGPYGPQGQLWFGKETGTPVAMRQRLTLGRGKPYEIQIKHKNSEVASQEKVRKTEAAFERWTALREALALEPGAREVAWSDEQLALLQERLPQAVALAADTPLAGIAAEAEEDLQLQTGRSSRVAALQTRLVDRPAPGFTLQALRGEAVANNDLAGAVTVLHFWEYRDAPLEEPYGQVGYLDFLYRKHKEAGLKVYGVAVDERLSNPATRGPAVSSARKLQSFMNLSYPLLLDDGTTLKRFGDPRAAGGKLPLYVIIAPDGKVLHYHAGFHEVDRDLGLKALDATVTKALKK